MEKPDYEKPYPFGKVDLINPDPRRRPDERFSGKIMAVRAITDVNLELIRMSEPDAYVDRCTLSQIGNDLSRLFRTAAPDTLVGLLEPFSFRSN